MPSKFETEFKPRPIPNLASSAISSSPGARDNRRTQDDYMPVSKNRAPVNESGEQIDPAESSSKEVNSGKLILSEPHWKNSDGFKISENLAATVKHKEETAVAIKKITFTLVSQCTGKKEQKSNPVEANFEAGSATVNLMLAKNNDIDEELKKNPEAKVEYWFVANHEEGEAVSSEKIIHTPEAPVTAVGLVFNLKKIGDSSTPVELECTDEGLEEWLEVGKDNKLVEWDSKEVKAWVNLQSSCDSLDWKGNLLKLEIGGKGDSALGNALRKAPAEAWVKVCFSGPQNKKSKRNNPVTRLYDPAGIDTSNADEYTKTEVSSDTERTLVYETKIILDQTTKTYTLTLDLGFAGGDTCKIELGSKKGEYGAPLKIVNWRELEYELIYPDFMNDKLQSIPSSSGNSSQYDLPSGLKSKLTERLGKTFIHYKLFQSHSFSKDKAGQGTIVKGKYLRKASPDDIKDFYMYAGGWDKPQGVEFSSRNGNLRRMQVQCANATFSTTSDECIVSYSQTGIKEIKHKKNLTGNSSSPYFFPYRTSDGSAAYEVAGYKWTAEVDMNACKKMPELTLKKNPQATGYGDENSEHILIELLGKENQVIESTKAEFVKDSLPSISKSLSVSAQEKIKNLVAKALAEQFVRSQNGTITIKMSFLDGNAVSGDLKSDRNARRNEVEREIRSQFTTLKREVSIHPGLQDNGDPLEGPMNEEWIINPDYLLIGIDFSKADGSDNKPNLKDLVGDMNDTKCPIRIKFKTYTTYKINGSATPGTGNQILQLFDKPDGPTASTICHELGHSMGMTILPGLNVKSPGTDTPLHVDQAATTGGPKGIYYSNKANSGSGHRNIHKGGHCADGLSEADKASFTFNKARKPAPSGTCIMWGSGGTEDNRPNYCATCTEHLQARNLKDIVSKWDGATRTSEINR